LEKLKKIVETKYSLMLSSRVSTYDYGTDHLQHLVPSQFFLYVYTVDAAQNVRHMTNILSFGGP